MSKNYADIFIEYFVTYIKREGADELLAWLKGTDFFTAPASTRYHSAHEGGLVEHCVNVFECMLSRWGETENKESLAICGLLHDVCKADFYTVSYRNAKNADGVWEKVPYYAIDDKMPLGHGEKSLFILERFLRLTISEALAVRWHMGGFDEAVRGGSRAINDAYDNYPLAVKLHIADIEATYLMEER